MKNESEPVVLVEYDERWPRLYTKEADVLLRALPSELVAGIEHVGSTAIPGMIAKPIVDIALGVTNLHDVPARTDRFWANLGYEWGFPPGDDEEWLFFIKRDPRGERIVHLHIVPFGGGFWTNVVAFRDALRDNASLADEYRRLKIALAVEYGYDRLRYLDGKASFVKRVAHRRLEGE